MTFSIDDLLNSIRDGFLQPLLYPLDPSRRLFWLFLLSSLLMAIYATWSSQSKQHKYSDSSNRSISFKGRRLCRLFFSKQYWINRSSLKDVFWLLTNSGIKVAILAPLFISHLAAAVWLASQLQLIFGDAPQLGWSPLSIAITYTLVFFITEDLSRFSLHVAMHKIPLLWRFHRVHHSATTLTPLTVHRVHPVEMSLYFVRGWCTFAIVSGIFVYLFHGKVTAWDILGVDALGFFFNLLGANLRHSHIWLCFGLFEKLFISPAQHQLHHSQAPEHRNINFGTCLAFWDKLLGSWRSGKKKPSQLKFGL